jgi:hypothetical protein
MTFNSVNNCRYKNTSSKSPLSSYLVIMVIMQVDLWQIIKPGLKYVKYNNLNKMVGLSFFVNAKKPSLPVHCALAAGPATGWQAKAL